jgi:hypothetical protein
MCGVRSPFLIPGMYTQLLGKTMAITWSSLPKELAMLEVLSCLAVAMVSCESLPWCILFKLTVWTRNPGGVRFGSAEIYDIIEMCFSHSATSNPSHIIVDCLVVGQSIDGGMDERVILFVQLKAGETLSLDLQKKIVLEIRTRRTPRHVPAMVKCNNPNASLTRANQN